MDQAEYVVTKMGRKSCVVHMTLPNGYELVEAAICCDPANYDEDVGLEVAKKNLETRVWQSLGYAAHLGALPLEAMEE